MKKPLLPLLIFVAACLACAHGNELNAGPGFHFTFEMPDGWYRMDREEYVVITKNNAFRQYAMIQERPLGKPFKHTGQLIKVGMLPEEAAGVVVDEIEADRNILSFELVENVPASIVGHEGFKITYRYRDTNGMAYRTVYYGFIRGGFLFNLRYTALEKFYEESWPSFQHVLDTFRLVDPQPA
jgi:hypothetical protein